MRKGFVLIAVVCLLAAACGTPPKPRLIVNSWTIESDYDKVWSATVETFADLGIPIKNMDKASGLITTDWMTPTALYVDCGAPPLARSIIRRGQFNVFIKQGPPINFKVNAHFQMEAIWDAGSKVTDCVSTGRFEAALYQSVSDKVK
jgi:hypothetical protein